MRSNPDRSVLTWLDAQSVESLYLATVSLSELLLGIASLPAGKRRSALASALDEQIVSLFAERIVPFDIAGAEAYAEIVTRARRHGHSIAVADAQIAAIAASLRFILATRDEDPFLSPCVPAINPWTTE